jgi:hypothetical protein
MIHDSGRARRLFVLGAAAVGLLAVTGGGAVLAGSDATTASSPTVAAAASPVPATDGPVAATATPVAATDAPVTATDAPVAATSAPATDQSNPFVAAVQALVADGTINQHQADVLNQDIEAGSINPQDLIDGGVLTAAQMQVVNARLGAVKRSLATGPDDNKSSAASETTKRAASDAARADEAVTQAAFDAAVQALVTDGAIDQAQADVLRQGIDAGSIDEQALIDNGTFTAAQMQAVRTRLSAVKESFASKSGDPASTAAPTSKDPSKTK